MIALIFCLFQFLYCSSILAALFLHGGTDYLRRVITLPICKLAVLAALQFLFYAAAASKANYYVVSLRLDHVRCGMLFWLPHFFGSALSPFRFYMIAE